MASVNKVILVGNLGRDPEMRAFPSGDQICNLRLATTDKWRDKQSGEMREHTEWHSIVFGGRLAEIAGQYLKKGSQVYVEGSLRTRKWQDKETGQDRYATEIRGDTMQMLGSREGRGEPADRDFEASRAPSAAKPAAKPAAAQPQAGSKAAADSWENMDDDIPF